MKQKEKDLLFKDLCARLPFGVKVKMKYYDDSYELLAIYRNGTIYAARDIGYPIEALYEDCKPYLIPIESMTKKQITDLTKFVANGIMNENIVEDWYNKNHIDYRGLIPMGIAEDATGKNIY